jgi:hypothetical protein
MLHFCSFSLKRFGDRPFRQLALISYEISNRLFEDTDAKKWSFQKLLTSNIMTDEIVDEKRI